MLDKAYLLLGGRKGPVVQILLVHLTRCNWSGNPYCGCLCNLGVADSKVLVEY